MGRTWGCALGSQSCPTRHCKLQDLTRRALVSHRPGGRSPRWRRPTAGSLPRAVGGGLVRASLAGPRPWRPGPHVRHPHVRSQHRVVSSPRLLSGCRPGPRCDCGSALSGRGTGQRPPSGGGVPTLRVAATGGPMGPHVCKTPRSCTPRTHAFAVSGTPQGSWAEPRARLRWHAHGGAPARPDLTGGRVMTHVTPAAAAVIFALIMHIPFT